MSNEGRHVVRDAVALDYMQELKRLRRHELSNSDFVKGYGTLARRAADETLMGLRTIAPELLGAISDDRTLMHAWDRMSDAGSDAPDPSGYRYRDFTPGEVGNLCRKIGEEIRAGDYRPGYEHVRKISKGPGRKPRELAIQGIFDRAVARAVVEVLQPLLDPLFDPLSFGFRPKQGSRSALATLSGICRARKSRVWVSVDIRDAFPSVPMSRLLDVFGAYLPDDELRTFVGHVSVREEHRGLRQGNPLSPLLLNLYLHHSLDRKWRQLHPGIPLLRFADDILLLCDTALEAKRAYASLVKLLTPAGFQLKEKEPEAIRNIAEGRRVDWLGFDVGAEGSGLSFRILDSAWDRLKQALAEANQKPLSPIAAQRSALGWLGDKSPCYPHVDRDQTLAKFLRLAETQGFDEMPAPELLDEAWLGNHSEWMKTVNNVDVSLAGALKP